MSSSFDVYPSTDNIPSFQRLLDVATGHLRKFLGDYEVSDKVELAVSLRGNDDEVLQVALDRPLWWEEGQYAWFHISGLGGGSHVYAESLDDFEQFVADGNERRAMAFRSFMQRSQRICRRWSFNLSGGQRHMMRLAHGLLAASLAELTDGLIDSIDGAWNDEYLPARPNDFLRLYGRPEAAKDGRQRMASLRIIEEMRKEAQIAAGQAR